MKSKVSSEEPTGALMIRTVGWFVKTSSVSVPAREGHEFHSCREPLLQVVGTAESRALPRRSKHKSSPKTSGLEQSGETTQVRRPQNDFCDAMASVCSALRMCERVVSLMRTPCFGRRVKLGTKTTGCPGTISSWN